MINFYVLSQVENNSIHQRLELKLSDWVYSNTANSTVEWSCINKALTNKCLVYHNDQWFYFTPSTDGNYFLNVSSQTCRKLQGVQMIVIEGNPCEVDTYRIIQCVPKIFMDDVFIELDSLKANTLYLVNIDGFLGDFCEFSIQLSDRPLGIPLSNNSLDTLELSATINKDIVRLYWHAESAQLNQLAFFELYRLMKGEAKSDFKGTISIESNALGRYVEDYFFTDTLTSRGEYQYKIVGIEKNTRNRLLLDRTAIHYASDKSLVQQHLAQIPLSFPTKGKVEIAVMNPNDNRVLISMVYEYSSPEPFAINLTRFVDRGIMRFWITVRHVKSKDVKRYTFKLKEDGLLGMAD